MSAILAYLFETVPGAIIVMSIIALVIMGVFFTKIILFKQTRFHDKIQADNERNFRSFEDKVRSLKYVDENVKETIRLLHQIKDRLNAFEHDDIREYHKRFGRDD